VTTLERNFERSVASAEGIRWLRGYLQGLLDNGEDPAFLCEILKRAREKSAAQGRDDIADLMLDGIDLLTGWHGPGMGVEQRKTA
jgi:hypothetical protein